MNTKGMRENLIEWAPGVSGNPQGRPKNTGSITYWYKELLKQDDGLSAREIAAVVIKRARDGSLPHALEVTERTDGKVATEVNMRALIVNVGDDYARLGLEAVRQELEQKQKGYQLAGGEGLNALQE